MIILKTFQVDHFSISRCAKAHLVFAIAQTLNFFLIKNNNCEAI